MSVTLGETIAVTPLKWGEPGIDWYQVHEIFESVQGEGMYTGRLATFIRLQGCTVGCPWCDSGPLSVKGQTNGLTSNTWGRGGHRMLTRDIVTQTTTEYVVITGGEPTLWNLDGILDALRADQYVSLETSGQNPLKGVFRPNWITWSPKAPLQYKAAKQIETLADEVKWVIDQDITFEIIWQQFERYLRYPRTRSYNDLKTPYFVLMPEGCPPGQEMVDKALSFLRRVPSQYQSAWRFADRLQYRLNVQ